MKACAGIITTGMDKEVFCKLDSWRRLMDACKMRG
jgi:hypothetical protein